MEQPIPRASQLYGLLGQLTQLYKKTDKAVENVSALKRKGADKLKKTSSIVGSDSKKKAIRKSWQYLETMCDILTVINEDLELEDEEGETIPFMSAGCDPVELKFLSGQNPWDFWLFDDKFDKIALHKILQLKYENDLFEPYENPKLQDSVCFLERKKVFRGIVVEIVKADKLRIQDCDSDSCCLVLIKNVFRADPDASGTYASALHCTISKNTQENLWNSDLQTLFCNILKEAVLSVEILDCSATDVPRFLVSIEMEEGGHKTNLYSWIYDRLLPELQKLKQHNSENVYEFLSSEVIDPYHSSNRVSEIRIQETGVNIPDNSNQDTEVKKTSNTTQESPSKQTDNSNQGTEIKKTNHSNQMSKVDPINCEDVFSSLSYSQLTNMLNLTSGKDSAVVLKIDLNDYTEINDRVSTNVTTISLEEGSRFGSISEKDSTSCNIEPSCSNSVIRNGSIPNDILRQRLLVAQQRPLGPVEEGRVPHLPHVPPIGTTSQYYPSPPRPPLQPQLIPQYPPFNHPPHYPNHTTVYQGVPISYQSNPAKYHHPQLSSPWLTSYVRPVQDNSQDYSRPPAAETTTRNISRHSSSSLGSAKAKEFVQHQLRQSKENISSQPIVTDEERPVSPPDPEKTYYFDLKSQTSLLKPNENLQVVVSYIVTPAEFYVIFYNENYKLLKKMEEDMLIYYSSRQPMGYKSWQQAMKSLGKFCVAKWRFNDHYYRVEILDWYLWVDQVELFFVDYGWTKVLQLNCLYPLTQNFSKLPMCAQRCHLAKTRPPNKLKDWPDDSIDTFKLTVKLDEANKYTISVVPAKKKDLTANSMAVMLVQEGEGDTALSINDLMMIDYSSVQSSGAIRIEIPSSSESSDTDDYQSLDQSMSENPERPLSLLSDECLPKLCETNGFADEFSMPHLVPNVCNKRREKRLDSWNPMSGARNNPRLDTEDAGVALTGYKAMDEARACRFGLSCHKANCRKEHFQLNPDAVTADQELIDTKGVDINLPEVGEECRVKVTAVENIDLFYVQLEEARGITVDYEDRETLTQMTKNMNQRENVQRMKYLEVNPAIAQLVLAKFDNMWHRARVIDIDDKEDEEFTFEVCFIDYGTVSTLKIEDLRKMEPQYMHLPVQSIECRLANIRSPTNEALRDKATELLEGLILGKICRAKVYDSVMSNSMEVLLTYNNQDVGEVLIHLGAVDPESTTWPPPLNKIERIAPG